MDGINTLQLRDNARAELMQIKDIETGFEYLSKVKAIEVWAKAEKKDAKLQNLIAEQKIRTQRILGQLIKDGQDAGEIAKQETGLNRYTKEADLQPRTLSEIGLTAKESSTFKQIASIPDDLFESTIAEKKEAVNRAVNELTTAGMLKVAKMQSLSDKKAEYIQQTKREIQNKPTVFLSDAASYLTKYADDSIDLILTDPPYKTDVDDIVSFTKSWLPIAIQKTKKTGRIYICSGAYPEEISAFLNVLLNQDKFIVDAPLIWTYRNTLGVTPKMKYNLNYQIIWHLYSENSSPLDTSITNEMFSVQDINAPDGRQGNRLHTWQKPDELAYRLIRHSTKENDIVIDPFVCTGTFLLAAAKLNRIAAGCDISEDNIKIAEGRGCIIIGL